MGANAHVDPAQDVIRFHSSLAGKTITSTSTALPAITDPVKIQGPGASKLTISGNNVFRVFDISNAGAVTISGLTITEGISGSDGFGGAGIRNTESNLKVDGVVVTGNTTTEYGGGILNMGAAALLTVNNSVIDSNAARYGGGIYNDEHATINVNHSTITNNTATQDGGGLYHWLGAMTINVSTISYNTAYTGGGIENHDLLRVNSSTLLGNQSRAGGGGVYTNWDTTITNSTIVNNTALENIYGGGGIHQGSGDLTVANCTITGNVDASESGESAGGISTVRASGYTFALKSSIVAQNLGPIQNNGGPILTRVPLSGSPAIDNGANSGALANDQRGPGFDRSIGVAPDIGAAEFRQKGARLWGDSSFKVLVVLGSAASDQILVSQSGASLKVNLNGQVQSFNLANIVGIVIFGLQGHDRIEIASSLALGSLVDGGSGNDTLLGCAGTDILLGRDGDDVLQGRGGRDILIGGAGKDTLTGGAADDLLIGGGGLQRRRQARLGRG